MTTISSTHPSGRLRADMALRASGMFWFLTAVIGQGLFIYFIASFYYRPTLAGRFEAWNRKDLITGFVAGDRTGNLAFAGHVLLAAWITASGALQFIPRLRARAMGFHRWNGRFYILASFLMGLSGLWLSWVRGTFLTYYALASGSILAILTMLSAALTLTYAMSGKIDAHQRWAMRTFLLVNGVWFQRVGYMAWIIFNHGPVGIGNRMDGPFDIILGFAEYVIPLTVLEIYLRARDQSAVPMKLAVSMGLFVMTVVMGVGIYGTWAIMWRPFL